MRVYGLEFRDLGLGVRIQGLRRGSGGSIQSAGHTEVAHVVQTYALNPKNETLNQDFTHTTSNLGGKPHSVKKKRFTAIFQLSFTLVQHLTIFNAAAGEGTWQIQGSQGQILAVAFRLKSFKSLMVFPLRSEAGNGGGGGTFFLGSPTAC